MYCETLTLGNWPTGFLMVCFDATEWLDAVNLLTNKQLEEGKLLRGPPMVCV